ncbi:MAG: 1-acyl-sn-glycerol-3-phosphate acyltransferase [Spirochaetaceae bacterium]|nr:MAG: 1-acyl-sn-glycerol-3-phosphate acyltransferase [Spirochaetaceae bacterium]
MIRFFFDFLVSLIVWSISVIVAIPLFLIGLVIRLLTGLFDKRLFILHQYSCFWAGIYTFIHPFWRVKITGRRNIRPGVAYVLVSNHQSLVDILVLYRLFKHFKWVSKAELFKVPIFGWHMSVNRYIRLDREDMRSQFKMLKTAMKNIEEGNSIMLFPEGTRTEDGNLRRFKEGAFMIAKKTGAPIVPIVINGTFNAMPKNSLLMHNFTRMEVTILPEITAEEVAAKDVKELTAQAQSAIQANLKAVTTAGN